MRFWWGGKWQRMNNERTNEWDATCKHIYVFFEQFSSFRNIFDNIKEPRRNCHTLDSIVIYWTQSPLTLTIFLCWSHIDVIFVRLRYVKSAKLNCHFLTTSTKQFVKHSVDNSLFYQFCEWYDGFNLKYSLPDHLNHLYFYKQKIDRIITNNKTSETVKSNENEQSNKKRIKSK